MGMISEEYLRSVVNIETKGKSDIKGTGFFVNKEFKDKTYYFMVTNKHVIEKSMYLYLNFFDSNLRKYIEGDGINLNSPESSSEIQ